MPTHVNLDSGKCSTQGCGRDCDPASFKVRGEVIGPYCTRCWEYKKLCDSCGKLRSSRDARLGSKNSVICHECLDKPSSLCPGCKRNVFGPLQSNGVCPICNANKFKCEICEGYHDVRDNAWNDIPIQLEYHEIFKETVGGICLTCAHEVFKGVEKNEIGTCACGKLTIDYYVDNGTKTFSCSTCLGRLTPCGSCGKLHSRGRTSFDGVSYCKKCLVDEFYYCTMCNKEHRKESQQGKDFTLIGHITINHVQVESIICIKCTELVGKCDRCSSIQHKSNLITFGDKKLCGNCAEWAGICSKCKKVSFYKDRVGGRDYCRKCAGEMGTGRILNYSYTPPPSFHGKGKLFLGFENETSFTSDDHIVPGVAYIYSKFEEDELIIKSDSSINTGFEIVSHPFDFDEIKKKSWLDLFPPKCRQHSSCGMHIHMSKDAFTTFHLFKFLEFINFNPNFIRTIAGRDENHYSQALNKTTDIAKSKHTNTRYSKVNLNKKHTVELRFFAHAVTEDVFLKNIEFAQALYEFSRDNTPKISKQITKFLEYIKGNLVRFNNLGAFLGMVKKEGK